jgi:TldD protein
LPLATKTVFLQWNQALRDAAGGADHGSHPVRIFLERREDLTVELTADGATSARRTLSSGVSATRIGAGGRMVYRSDPSLGEIERVARAARTDLAHPNLSDGADGPRATSEGPDLGDDPSSAMLRVAERVGRLQPTAQVVGRAVVFEQQIRVAWTGGTLVEDRRRGLRLRFEATLDRRSARSSAAVEAVRPPTAIDLDDSTLDRIALQLSERLEARLHAREPSSGEFDTVFGPGVGGVLVHEIVGHALEADVVLDGRSWLAAEDGRVAPSELLILDDPRRGRAAWRLDDEGQRARPVPLIRSGHVAGRLHDIGTAARAEQAPTGHGRRASFREPVRPRMGCTFVAAGRWSPEEILNSIGDGVYVRRMEAANIDLSSGRAVFRVTDSDRIVRGKLDAPLHSHLLVVQGRNALSNMNRVADDLEFDTCAGSCVRLGQPLAMSVGAPTICTGRTWVVR